MPYARNEIPDKKPPPSAMFEPFTGSSDSFLGNVDTVTVPEDQRVATDVSETVRDGNTANTA